MAPELAETELTMRKKLTATSGDQRGYSVALASFHRWRGEHRKVEYGQKVSARGTLIGPRRRSVNCDCGCQVDVYAFAITMFEIVSHRPPWEQLQEDNDSKSIFQR
jgi:serine/threonine protein kinase